MFICKCIWGKSTILYFKSQQKKVYLLFSVNYLGLDMLLEIVFCTILESAHSLVITVGKCMHIILL